MEAHHHILLWLVIIYLVLGVATYFIIGGSYIDIVIWPKHISAVLSSLGIGG